jgi:DNA polymerase-3 subunit alpha
MDIKLPIRCRSHYSLLDSVLRPQDIVNISKTNNTKYACQIDYNNLSGSIEFYSKCIKNEIIPIIGVEIPVDNSSTIVFIAKNLDGYNELLKIVFDSNISSCQLNFDNYEYNNILVCYGYNGSAPISKIPYKHSFKVEQEITVHQNNADIDLLQIVTALKYKTTVSKIKLNQNLDSNKFIDSSILDHIEKYDIASKPKLPKFDGIENNVDLFNKLVYSGLQRLNKNQDTKYVSRLESELNVLNSAGLANYFLVLYDIVKFAKQKDSLSVGPGRGSSAGCLTSYCLDITSIDPLKHNLIFERFYNAGRNTKDYVSLPDIDIDFASESRSDVIEYIKSKYGDQNVAHIATYQTLMGRAAISGVFRTVNNLEFRDIKLITKNIDDKAKIADDLQHMKESGEEPSVIKWALLNKAKKLEEWCVLKDNKYEGQYANEFRMAVALEGLKCSLSKHAAGIVISPKPMREFIAMVWDPKDKQMIIGPEMNEIETVGATKLDCLGLASISKIRDTILGNYE